MEKKGKTRKFSSGRIQKSRSKEDQSDEELEGEDWRRAMLEFKEEVSRAKSPYLDYYTFEDRSRRLANRHIVSDDTCYVLMFERDIKGPKMVTVLPNINESTVESASIKRAASSKKRKSKPRTTFN